MYLFQTNGYSISDEFVDFFIRHDILVSISLDGPREIHDRYRKDVHGLGTYDRVVETITRFKSAGVMFNILSVVTKDVAQHPKEVWDELFSYTSYVQFIPCDEPFFGTPQDYSVTAEQYGQFLIDTFDLFDLAIRSGLKIS